MISYLGEQIEAVFLWVVNLAWGPASEFKDPEFLWLLWLIPIYFVYYFWIYEPNRLVVPLSYNPRKLTPEATDWSWLRILPQIFINLGIFLMILALARPISAFESEDRFSEGIDIMIILDTSGSMETEDFQPNRLEVAKETAIKFINGRVDDRIGIVLFAEDAFSYAPLTLDYDLLKKQIDAISSNIMPKEGTAMGSAIAVGINRMEESDSPSQVMILLTDGASNRGQIDPLTAASLAEEKEIKVYCIGIGKEEFQRRTMFGTQTIKSDLDEETLKQIAEMTGGQFFRSTDEQSLDRIFDKISQMEKVEIKEERLREEKDAYPLLLLWGAIFFGLSLILMMTFMHNPLEG